MFVVKPKTPRDMVHAMFLISLFKVSVVLFSDGEHSDSVWIKLNREYRKFDLARCELTFQASFQQEGGPLCPFCEMLNEKKKRKEETCGHLTFTEMLRR